MVEQKQPTLIKAKTDDYRLKEMATGASPGIARTETDEHIAVTYSNRFTIYDEAETTMKPML